MDDITPNAMVTVLLCSYLVKSDPDALPYTVSEWYALSERIASSLIKEPANLMHMTVDEIRDSLSLEQGQAVRMFKLLSKLRNEEIACILGELEQKSIFIITRGDNAYPRRLADILGKKAPPLLYYCGKLDLADGAGIAIAGSRDIDVDSESGIYVRRLVKKAVEENYSVYSGGAKGVDQISEKAALEAGGCCISFLAGSMTQKIQQMRCQMDICKASVDGKMLFLSAVNPDAPFNSGNAMSRNKYIYAMSKCAFVIASDYNKGGTWNGAIESIKSRLVNTYIWDNPKYEGNKQLILRGGIPIPDEPELPSIDALADNKPEP